MHFANNLLISRAVPREFGDGGCGQFSFPIGANIANMLANNEIFFRIDLPSGPFAGMELLASMGIKVRNPPPNWDNRKADRFSNANQTMAALF